jgi:hypothetical protein
VTLHPLDTGADVAYRNVPDGANMTIRANHVRASDATASDLVGEACIGFEPGTDPTDAVPPNAAGYYKIVNGTAGVGAHILGVA